MTTLSRRTWTPLRNQRGAATLLLLTLLPLLIALASVSIAVYMMLVAHTATLQTCRESLLQTEKSRLETMSELFKLNPQAQRLRRERAQAEKAAASATLMGPQARAAAELQLRLVIARQLMLAARQKELISSADRQTGTALRRLRFTLQERFSLRVVPFTEGQRIPLERIRWEHQPLAVRAVPSNELTPNYEPRPDLESRHILRVRWRWRPSAILPSWLGFKSGSDRGLLINAQCASTAERTPGGRSWRARLEKDKR